MVLAGGVASNSGLRNLLNERTKSLSATLYCPDKTLCTDNAAMIGLRAYYSLMEGKDIADLSLNADSGLL